MKTISFNFHNEQEEKVLLAFLDSLHYDYESIQVSETALLSEQSLAEEWDSEEDSRYEHYFQKKRAGLSEVRYQQGDIIWVDFPFTDGTQSKPRPALILSNRRVNQTGDYIVVQITSRVKNDGLSLAIKDIDYLGSPLELASYVRFHKIFTLNESLILSKKTAVTVDFRIKVAIQIELLIR